MSLPFSLQQALDALLTQPGETTPSLRSEILERNRFGSGSVPEDIRSLVDKIAHQPHSVNDQDFDRLRAAGHSDGQLYDITLAAALGAALRRFDAGLRAIDEVS
jgi:alkylhydroperoxidase family enzyme